MKFSDIKLEDWTEEVKPFWLEVIKTALTPSGLTGLLTSNVDTIKVETGLLIFYIKYTFKLIDKTYDCVIILYRIIIWAK